MARRKPVNPAQAAVLRSIERNMDTAYSELDGLLTALHLETCGTEGYNRLWELLQAEQRKLREWKRLRSAAKRLA